MSYHDSWLAIDPVEAVNAFLASNSLVPYLDYQIANEVNHEAIRGYKITIAEVPFTKARSLPPTVFRTLLVESKDYRLQLGTLALCLWLDRSLLSLSYVTNTLADILGVDPATIRQAGLYARGKGVLRALRSRPDVGHHHRK